MNVVGIIAEYNPFHSGHHHHISEIKKQYGDDTFVICVMSGNWVQRGDAALCDKWARSAMALDGGADLILELPTVWACSSAEHFAFGGLSHLDACGLVDTLSFGSEIGAVAPLQAAASCLSSPAFSDALRSFLDSGLSFQRARQEAASALLGADADCLQTANNNLGVEYLRALARLDSSITPSTITRSGAAHDSAASSAHFASASHLRARLLAGADPSTLAPYMSTQDLARLGTCGLASLRFATRAVFARLRCMDEAQWRALPDCSEGLEQRLLRAALETSSLEDLYQAAKSRRYAHARIRRLVLWAYLGLSVQDRPSAPQYLRVLGSNARGRTLLRRMKQTATVPILTKAAHVQRLPQGAQDLFSAEVRCTALYELCHADFGRGKKLDEFLQSPLMR